MIDIEKKAHDAALTAQALVDKVCPILAGQPPETSGGALAQLVAMWIAAHHPEIRSEILADWMILVQKLMPVVAKELFRRDGFPRLQ